MLVARVLCRIKRTIYFFNNCSAKYKNKLDSIKNIIKDKKKKKSLGNMFLITITSITYLTHVNKV